MTTDVELLPLPEWAVDGTVADDDLPQRIQDYARANVEHHAEALRKDYADLRRDWDELEAVANRIRSWNEALRAEVERLKHHGTLLSNIAYNLAQDERLSELVRWSLDDARKKWDAALHPTAAQEGKSDE